MNTNKNDGSVGFRIGMAVLIALGGVYMYALTTSNDSESIQEAQVAVKQAVAVETIEVDPCTSTEPTYEFCINQGSAEVE